MSPIQLKKLFEDYDTDSPVSSRCIQVKRVDYEVSLNDNIGDTKFYDYHLQAPLEIVFSLSINRESYTSGNFI